MWQVSADAAEENEGAAKTQVPSGRDEAGSSDREGQVTATLAPSAEKRREDRMKRWWKNMRDSDSD